MRGLARNVAVVDGLVMEKKRLLLLSDEGYVISRVMEILLGFPWFEAEKISDAEEARAALEEKSFDVVISDIYLRGASGLEFSFKAREKNPETCVILLTGIDNADMAAKAVKEGAFDYVVKPPGLERLAGLLKMYSLLKGLIPEKSGSEQP